MRLILTRETFLEDRTLGRLKAGDLVLYTLEDRVREDGVKVYGETAIPAGEYKVKLTYSPKFKIVTPILEDVPGFSHIRIHAGNDPKDTHGCILVGLSISEANTLVSSRRAFRLLMTALQADETPHILTISIA